MAPLLALYCVVLGVKFAKAEEPQEREKTKGALKNAIIGFVLIFVLIPGLNIMMPQMIKWVNTNNGVVGDSISQAQVTDVQSQAGKIQS